MCEREPNWVWPVVRDYLAIVAVYIVMLVGLSLIAGVVSLLYRFLTGSP